MERVVEAFNALLPIFIDEATDRLKSAGLPSYAPFTREQLHGLVAATFSAFSDDLRAGTTTALPTYLQSVGPHRAEQGALVQDMLRALQIGIEIATGYLQHELSGDDVALGWWHEKKFDILYAAASGLSQTFVTVRERVIREQALQLREVSAPVVPIYNGILVLPLVGTIDAQRAGQIMEALLTAITKYVAEAVIVDITGVPFVDTDVANYLLQTAQAVGLLGSRLILVGISPDIALTIINLGVDLGSVTTRANLEDGMTFALSLQGRAIGRTGSTSPSAP